MKRLHIHSWGTRAILLGLLSTLAFALAQAQTPPARPMPLPTSAISLPLSSVGREVGWSKINGEDDYRLAVFAQATDQLISLDLYSPEINLNDYANKRNVQNYYGDEIYKPGSAMKTTFTLSDKVGRSGGKLAEETFGNGTAHSYNVLFSGSLPQGYYPIRVTTEGNGKNAFSFRVPPGTAVEASQFTVVTRGKFNQDQLVARVTINKSLVGNKLKLSNFDGDGPKELELRVRFPNGKLQKLTISSDNEWKADEFVIRPDMVGEWAILARILPTTKQFSNSFSIRVRVSNQPYFARVPQTEVEGDKGILEVRAKANVCGRESDLGERVQYRFGNGTTYSAPDRRFVLAGGYTVTGQTFPGATLEPVKLEIKKGQTGAANLVYKVAQTVKIEPSNLLLETGAAGTAKVTVSTEFPLSVPYVLDLKAPDGVTLSQTHFEGTVKAGDPAELSIAVRSERPVSGKIEASLGPDCPGALGAQAGLQVQNRPAALSLSKTVTPAEAKPGDSVAYTLTVTNTGGTAVQGAKLSDLLPAGLQGKAIDETFDIGAGETKTFTTTAAVTQDAPEKLVNTANLTWIGPPQSASATVNVAPLQAQPKQPTPTGKLVLTRTALTPNPAFPGEETKVCLQVKNEGDAAADYTLTDDSTGLLESKEDKTFKGRLEPGVSAEHCYTARTTAGTDEKSTLSATLTLPGQPDQTATTPFERVNLGLSKAVDKPTVQTGEQATYTITVTNPLNRKVTADLKGDSKLQLTPGESRTLDLEPGPNSFKVTGTPQAAGDYPNTVRVFVNDTPVARDATATVTATAQPAPPPQAAAKRESEIVLAARLVQTPENGTVILSDRIPAGTQYVLGSTRLLREATPAGSLEPAVVDTPTRENSAPLADPLVAEDRLYWSVPGPLKDTYVLSYRLTHADPIELPEDRLGVILQLPQSKSAGKPRTPNGQPVLGSLGDLLLLQGSADVLSNLPNAEPIATQADVSDFSLVQGGGKAAEIMIYPARPLTTDKADQNELVIVVRDSQGNPANEAYVSADISPEPVTPDPFPEVPGYQVKLENGQGYVRLSDLGQSGQGLFTPGTPDVVTVTVRSGGIKAETTLKIEATSRPMIVVGAAGIQLNLTNFNTFSIETSLNAFAKGDILFLRNRALFTGAINTGTDFSAANGFLFKNSNLLPPANPFERFPLTGDGQVQGSDADSSDCCFLRLERGPDYLQYGQTNPAFGGILTGYSAGYNGLKGVVRDGAFSFNTFAALVPNANQRSVLPADRSSVYRLPVPAGLLPIVENSEQVQVVVRNRDNANIVLSRTNLIRNSDYTIDYPSGIITLRAPLEPTDLNGNPQSLEISYAIGTPDRELRAGAQVGFDAGNFGLRATLLRYDATQSPLLGFGFRYRGGPLSAEAELAAGLNALSLAAGAANLTYDTDNFDLSARYQDVPPGYIDPRSSQPQNPARDLALNATWQPSERFSLAGAYSLSQNYLTGSVSQQLGAEGRLSLGSAGLLLGGGAGFGLDPKVQNNFSTSNAYLSAGLEAMSGRLTATLRQIIGLGNTPGATDLSLDYALSANFGVRLENRLSYTASGLYDEGSLGVRGSFTNADLLRRLLGNSNAAPDPTAEDLGTTNIAATYELPNLSGQAGVTRVGLDTRIPLGDQFSMLLAGSLTLADAGQGGAGASLGFRYTGESLKASLRAELSGQAIQPGLKQVYDFGVVWKASDLLIISPVLQYVREATGDSGSKFSLAGAYRGDRWSFLTNNLVRTGFFQADDGTIYEGELRGSYEADERWFLRAGLAGRLSDPNIWTFQVGGGFTYFLTDFVGLGASASYLFQPITASGQLSLGLEGSLRVADGLLFSAGVNVIGTRTSLAGFQTRPGLYLRLDWKFDETTFGVRY